jgi:hypothetical protein
VDWIHLAQDRDQWQALMNSNEPSGSIKGREFLDQLSFLRRRAPHGVRCNTCQYHKV